MTNVASSLSLMQIESLKTETNTEPGEMCSLEQLEFSKQWDSTQSGCDSFHGDS